jgi:hypothetical protein
MSSPSSPGCSTARSPLGTSTSSVTVSARSRRQSSVLAFLAQDAEGRAFCYSNADIRKGEESEEIFRFISFWKRTHGTNPRHLVFDSRLTTYPSLARLEKMGITFITLRRRTPKLLQEVAALPRSAWRTIELDVPTRKYKTPRIHEHTAALAGETFRQIFIRDLGHDEPTLLLTNDRRTSAAKLITRYAQRMLTSKTPSPTPSASSTWTPSPPQSASTSTST